MNLGRIGLWSPLRLFEQEGARLPETMAELDASGFGTVWLGNGPAIMEMAATVLDATSRITVATGIANIWVHPAAAIAAHRSELAGRHPGRLLLGLGNGPREASQWALSPYQRMVAYFDELDTLGTPAGSRVLAASGPRMLALAAERSIGAHPFLTTAEHTHLARTALGEGPLLAPELKVVLAADPATARATARQALSFYLAKRGYTANLRRLGFTDEDFAGGGSDRLVDAVVAWGDVETVLERVREHHRAGADHVALQVLTSNPGLPLAEYRELAAALR
ncbi:TIGR03620 family F420-dependent LLM class oxidoreductase [Amycolatopsis sp. NPDC058278]|uniref:TIGR03620 family F420-dependent LLM class oxidoreductase n=1 Tax=Amycolatopsis sp. NPDC058278 TaxID=3346417 RepID=UPI0036DC164D